MRMKYLKYALAVIVIALVMFVVRIGSRIWAERQWFELQHRQMATIERIGEFPPAGWDRDTWKNALVTPYNVWGNVTYHPNYSEISNADMRTMQRRLEQIVSETTSQNSLDSVDRVFQLLLERGRKTDFISGYREEFRTFDKRIGQNTDEVERVTPDNL